MLEQDTLQVCVYNATRTDWLSLKSLEGVKMSGPGEGSTDDDAFSRHGEPVTATLLFTIAVISSAALTAWLCKQRAYSRSTLRIEIRHRDGRSCTIDMSDARYREEGGDRQLVADVVKAGLGTAIDGDA